MKNPPNILSTLVVDATTVELAWSTGETLRVDLADLPRRNPAFAPLADPAFFARLERDEWGHGIGWPGGLDLGADRLYELGRDQAGLPTASGFDAWMQRNGLSLASAAECLGMTRRMIAHYRTGSKPIPKVVGLACKGWEAQHARHSQAVSA
ncbi:MAG: hypothetical protein RJA34_51 [Pseudomonadota bacterium]|jgi:hypothetical protein